MSQQQPDKFYFSGKELPLYSDYWWTVSNDLFEDYHELSFWEKQLCSYFSEIEWKLDKKGVPYSFDSNIFQLCCMALLKHIHDQKEKVTIRLIELNYAPEIVLKNLTDGLLNMIELAEQSETVWWINGNEEHRKYLAQVMESSKLPHEHERQENIKSSFQLLSKQLRKLTQQKCLDKETRRKINALDRGSRRNAKM